MGIHMSNYFVWTKHRKRGVVMEDDEEDVSIPLIKLKEVPLQMILMKEPGSRLVCFWAYMNQNLDPLNRNSNPLTCHKSNIINKINARISLAWQQRARKPRSRLCKTERFFTTQQKFVCHHVAHLDLFLTSRTV